MAKQHFFLKLITPRATFAQDMTNDERALMMQHAQYTQKFFDEGKVLIYGPVRAANETFGIAVLEMETEHEAREFGENDPSVLAGLNRFEISPMRLGDAQSSRS